MRPRTICGLSARVHSSAYLIEENRLAEQREKMAAQRAAREAGAADKSHTARMRPVTHWIDDVRDIIIKHGRYLFTLEDLMGYRSDLRRLHPDTEALESSVRWALQCLRKAGEVAFVDNHGSYVYLPFEREQQCSK